MDQTPTHYTSTSNYCYRSGSNCRRKRRRNQGCITVTRFAQLHQLLAQSVPPRHVCIPQGVTLQITGDLVVPVGVTLTNYGQIIIIDGVTVTNLGTLINGTRNNTGSVRDPLLKINAGGTLINEQGCQVVNYPSGKIDIESIPPLVTPPGWTAGEFRNNGCLNLYNLNGLVGNVIYGEFGRCCVQEDPDGPWPCGTPPEEGQPWDCLGGGSNECGGGTTPTPSCPGNMPILPDAILPPGGWQPLNTLVRNWIQGDDEIVDTIICKYGEISKWNVSKITNMNALFAGGDFNDDISNWNVNSVTDMKDMFSGTNTFNQNLASWNTSNVTDMSNMFITSSFNQPIGSWNVNKVKNMVSMFGCDVKCQLIPGNGSGNFNYPLNNWDVSSVTDMSNMFEGQKEMQQTLSSWNIQSISGKVDACMGFAHGAPKELICPDFPGVPTPKCGGSIGNGCHYFDICAAEGLYVCDSNCTPITQDYFQEAIQIWFPEDGCPKPTPSPTTPAPTPCAPVLRPVWFCQTYGNISRWNVSKVTNMSQAFQGITFNGDISRWDVSNVTNMSYMFEGSSFNGDISGWNTSQVTNLAGMFRKYTPTGGTAADCLFNRDIGGWNVSKVTDMQELFYQNRVFDQDLSSWNTSKVTNMYRTFSIGVFNSDITTWDTAQVVNMGQMFDRSSSFNVNISGWTTVRVKDMTQMFNQATQFNGDLSGWDTVGVTNMTQMFNQATQFNGDLSGWNVNQVAQCTDFANGTKITKCPSFPRCNSGDACKQVQKYLCYQGQCIPAQDGGGVSLDVCQAVCAPSPPPPGPTSSP